MACPYSAESHSVIGLPRPVAPDKNGILRPVPWSQQGNDERTSWGVIDDVRNSLNTEEGLCLVCGDHVAWGFAYVAKKSVREGLVIPDVITYSRLNWIAVADGGPLHERCEKITRAHCQSVRESLRVNEFLRLPYIDNRLVTPWA